MNFLSAVTSFLQSSGDLQKVAGEDEADLEPLGHAGVAGAVVHHNPAQQSASELDLRCTSLVSIMCCVD